MEGSREYLAEMSDVMTMAMSRKPDLPVYLLGHSAGGVISCMPTRSSTRPSSPASMCESFAFGYRRRTSPLAVVKGLSHIVPHTKC